MRHEDFPNGTGKVDAEDMRAVVDVAFVNCMEHREKRSFDKTIDIVMGEYKREGRYKGWLAICLKPSHGWKDWLINLCAFGSTHTGYRKEFNRHFSDINSMIMARLDLAERGIIISGRSKGGAEAVMLGEYIRLVHDRILVGAIEPPRAFGKKYAAKLERLFPILSTCYKNDIVPGIPPWYKTPGKMFYIGTRTNGLSIKDHEKSTTDDSIFYDYIKRMLP